MDTIRGGYWKKAEVCAAGKGKEKMKSVFLGKSELKVPAVTIGCMRLGEKDEDAIQRLSREHIILTMRISMPAGKVKKCLEKRGAGISRCAGRICFCSLNAG